jgi:periplasmic protein TonB
VWQHVDPTVKLDLTERRVMRLDQEVAGFPVSDPILLSAPEPGFPPLAREAHYGGISVIGAVINTSGTPEEIRIVRPVGMGLDEEAVYAVSQYRFRPATLNGKPVPVYVNIEVSFRNR